MALTLQIEWDGKSYSYSPADITVKTAMAIKDYTGLGMRSWASAVDDADPRALQGLLFAIKAQGNEPCLIATLEFSPMAFFEEITRASAAAVVADLERQRAADPDEAEAGPTETDDSPTN